MTAVKTINREPLGIRKLDVQARRRAYRKASREEAAKTVKFWFSSEAYRPMPLTEENVLRLAEVMLERGWEAGVVDGAAATRERVAESLANGRLVKT
jgi:hypothetical protein